MTMRQPRDIAVVDDRHAAGKRRLRSSHSQPPIGSSFSINKTLPVFLLLAVVTSLLTKTTHSYVISAHHAVPPRRQMEFLKEATYDFTHTTQGNLSPEQLSAAPRLLTAWSQQEYTKNQPDYPGQHQSSLGVERALALESLIKRWIDEIKVQEEQQQQQDSSSRGTQHLHPPTVEDYNCLLEGWARSGAGMQAAERCELILHAMEEQSSNRDCQPNLSSYKAALMAWRMVAQQNDANRKSQSNHLAALRAQRILETMIRNAETALKLEDITATETATSESSKRSRKKNKSNKRHNKKRSNQENSDTNVVKQQQQNIDVVLPDADCFDSVLQTWSRCATHYAQAPHHAEAVLALMERLYEQTLEPSIQPRTTSFNAVLATWARCSAQPAPVRAQRALDLLHFMQVLEEQGRQQEEQLQQEDDNVDDDNTGKEDQRGALSFVAPDNASYCTVMGALSRANHGDSLMIAEQAEVLLKQAEERYRQAAADASVSSTRKVNTIVPDTILYNTAMGCWAKTSEPGSYRRARNILDRQLRLCRDLKSDHSIAAHNLKAAANLRNYHPDVFGFTSVIASCAAEQKDKDRAFNVAFSTFRQMEDQYGIAPNHVTYGNMLKAVARLLPAGCPSRKKWAVRFFEQACEAGCVGDMVLSRTREALKPDTFAALMRGHSKHNLPKEWIRNLPEKNVRNERKKRLTRNLTWQQQKELQRQGGGSDSNDHTHQSPQQQRNEYFRKKKRTQNNNMNKHKSIKKSSPPRRPQPKDPKIGEV